MVKLLIYIILFVAFFGTSLEEYSIVPRYFSMLTEFSIYLLFIISLILAGKDKRKYDFHLSLLYFLFIIDAALSIVLNNSVDLKTLLGIRYLLRFYFLYLAIMNITSSEEQQRKFNKLIMALFIIQLPTQAIKFYFYGFSENTIGTYATHGGGLTTVIPLVALGYLNAYYCFYKKKKIYLILSVGFIAYGLIGIKLALLFIYPIAFLSLYYLNVIKVKGFQIPHDIYKIALISLIILVVSAVGIKTQPRANRERKVGGSIDLKYALEYSKNYTSGKSNINPELSAGRFATTKKLFKYLWEEDFVTMCFGYGPGVISKIMYNTGELEYKSNIEKIAGSYGKTGLVYITAEYGIIGMILITIIYSIFLRNSYKLLKIEKEPYWRAFASGSLFFSCIAMFIFIFYNKTTVIGEVIQPVFFYCMAIVYYRIKRSAIFRKIEKSLI